jgi:hypothetical protein
MSLNIAGFWVWLSQRKLNRQMVEMGCLQPDLGDVGCQVRTLLSLERQGCREVIMWRGMIQSPRRHGLLRVKGVSQKSKVRGDEDIPSTLLSKVVALFILINHLLAQHLNEFLMLGYHLAP